MAGKEIGPVLILNVSFVSGQSTEHQKNLDVPKVVNIFAVNPVKHLGKIHFALEIIIQIGKLESTPIDRS